MTYPEAIQFLYDLRLFGAKFGLENTFRLAALAGNPQTRLRFIHVAGTNGKGSTCAMLESIYRAAGLRTGLFTSPHLVSFRERIQVSRQLIPESDVVRLVEELRGRVAAGVPPAVEPGILPGGASAGISKRTGGSSASPGGRMPPSTSGGTPDATNRHDACPTFFEFVTVMALKYFAEQQCDLVIWETGLGGRLDATNIVTPLAGVITNIAFDHQQWLGDTLEKIAAEKAGIIKPGVPVLTATAEPAALAVIEQMAREKAAPLVKNISAEAGLAARLRDAAALPLLGEHQRLNAALALATVEVLQPQLPVHDAAIRAGLKAVQWPGRMQLVTRPSGQKMLLDGAHNVAGAEALRRTLAQHFGGARYTLVLGVLQDKDWRHIGGTLAPAAGRILTVPVASERTADARELAAACRAANTSARVAACDSLAGALGQVAGDEFVVVTGSLYLVGEALELLGLTPGMGIERGLNEWSAQALAQPAAG
jgi:dihydrofolate synthase / folylpolyglutamate synthase